MGTKPNIKKSFRNNIVLNLGAIAIVAVLLLVLTLMFLSAYTRHGQNEVVPRLQGLQVEEASAILKSKGLNIQIVDSIYQKNAVPGSIIDQKPHPDNKVKEGRDIYVTIYARNPQLISVPGLVDFSARQAVALLNSIGFTQIDIEEVPAQYSGLVISVEYRGKKLVPDEQIPVDSPLKLVVGRGISTDSLNMNNEHPVSTQNDRMATGADRNGASAQQSNMDESFF